MIILEEDLRYKERERKMGHVVIFRGLFGLHGGPNGA